jgi:hypothetical protein
VFAGWLTLGLGVGAGLVVSELLGLQHTEGPLPPVAVYGISDGVVLWIFVGAALLLAVPMAAAMVSEDPRSTLRPIAVGMGLAGLLLLPDPLGRAFGGLLVPGAVLVWLGGELIVRDTQLAGSETRSATGLETQTQPESMPAAAATSEPSPASPSAASPSAAAPVATQTTAAANLPNQAAPAAGRSSRKRGAAAMKICPWCSTEIAAAAESCLNCKAALSAPTAEQVPIPGVTEVSPELRRYAADARSGKNKPSLLRMMFSDTPIPTAVDAPPPSDADALRPPSSELRAEMARLDAEIAAGAIATGAPDAAPDGAPDATPEAAPDAAPDGAPDAAPDGAPDATPEAAPDAAPDGAPEATPATKPAPRTPRRSPRT